MEKLSPLEEKMLEMAKQALDEDVDPEEAKRASEAQRKLSDLFADASHTETRLEELGDILEQIIKKGEE